MSTMPDLAIREALQSVGEWLWPAADRLPEAVVRRAQRLWLDTASCAYSGAQTEPMRRWLALQQDGDGGSVPLPGDAARLSASAAATSFAMAACWDEACEGLALAHGRPGVPVVAALWSELHTARPTWQRLWEATAVGYEIGARLGARLRIRPGMHVDGVWGAFGAAAAVVRLRGGDWSQALRALEACAVQLPFSLYRPVREGADVRNLYLGHSAWLGLQAARAAEARLGTPAGAIDDFARMALDPAQAGEVPGPGEWLFLQSYWKPFAAVRHVHYGAQAALQLRQQLPNEDMPDELLLTVYPEALQYCGNRNPQTPIAAQFSLSFGVAAAWQWGQLSPAEFRGDRFTDARMRQLEQRVQVVADGDVFPRGRRGARLCARIGRRTFEVEQGTVLGDPGNEPRDQDVEDKYERLTQGDPAMQRWARTLQSAAAHATACWPGQGD